MNDCYLAALGTGVHALHYILFSGIVFVAAHVWPYSSPCCCRNANTIPFSKCQCDRRAIHYGECVCGWARRFSVNSEKFDSVENELTSIGCCQPFCSISIAENDYSIQQATAVIQKQFWMKFN